MSDGRGSIVSERSCRSNRSSGVSLSDLSRLSEGDRMEVMTLVKLGRLTVDEALDTIQDRTEKKPQLSVFKGVYYGSEPCTLSDNAAAAQTAVVAIVERRKQRPVQVAVSDQGLRFEDTRTKYKAFTVVVPFSNLTFLSADAHRKHLCALVFETISPETGEATWECHAFSVLKYADFISAVQQGVLKAEEDEDDDEEEESKKGEAAAGANNASSPGNNAIAAAASAADSDQASPAKKPGDGEEEEPVQLRKRKQSRGNVVRESCIFPPDSKLPLTRQVSQQGLDFVQGSALDLKPDAVMADNGADAGGAAQPATLQEKEDQKEGEERGGEKQGDKTGKQAEEEGDKSGEQQGKGQGEGTEKQDASAAVGDEAAASTAPPEASASADTHSSVSVPLLIVTVDAPNNAQKDAPDDAQTTAAEAPPPAAAAAAEATTPKKEALDPEAEAKKARIRAFSEARVKKREARIKKEEALLEEYLAIIDDLSEA
eukprot:m.6293 g.6293  ORF g.6293 m.6293 type:complete len:486 (-) comp2590_c0_seq1:126-1583(-)